MKAFFWRGAAPCLGLAGALVVAATAAPKASLPRATRADRGALVANKRATKPAPQRRTTPVPGASHAAFATATPIAPRAITTAFVGRKGTQFVLNGQPFPVAGTSIHYLGWGSKKEVDAVLEDARAMNFNVVRSILHSVIGSPDQSKPDAKAHIWNFKSTGDVSNMGMRGVYLLYWDADKNAWAWNDSTVNGLGRWDYVIARAGKLGLKLDLSLLDFWQWAGGAQQINAWYGKTDRYTSFYTDPRTKTLYKAWVSHVLNRRNTITGVQYKNEPAIFAWDLMNEPEVSSVELAQSWFREMSRFVKSIDANHLLTTGTEGFYDGRGGSDPQSELALPDIDFGTWHTYPVYHNISTDDVVGLIKRHAATAAIVGKPVILQEFGWSEKHPDQAEVYRKWTNAVRLDPNAAGWIVWRLEGRVSPPPTRPFPEGESEALGDFPPDNGEGFGIHRNANPTAQALAQAAAAMKARTSRG